MAKIRTPLSFHPALPVTLLKQDAESCSDELNYFGSHVAIFASVPLQENYFSAADKIKNSIHFISCNLQGMDADDALTKNKKPIQGEKKFSAASILSCHQQISETLWRMVHANDADVITLQGIVQTEDESSLNLLLEKALKKFGQDWGYVTEAEFTTFYRKDVLIPITSKNSISTIVDETFNLNQKENEKNETSVDSKKFRFDESWRKVGKASSQLFSVLGSNQHIFVHNFHAKSSWSPESHEYMIRSLLKFYKPVTCSNAFLTIVAIGDFNITVLPQTLTTNATTSVITNNLNQKHRCMCTVGVFYRYHKPKKIVNYSDSEASEVGTDGMIENANTDTVSVVSDPSDKNPLELTLIGGTQDEMRFLPQQAPIYSLDPITGRKFTDAELAVPLLIIKKEADAKDKELIQISKFYLAICIQEDAETMALDDYERLLKEKIDDSITVRLATNCCNERGISIEVPDYIYKKVKTQQLTEKNLQFVSYTLHDPKFYQISCAKHHLPVLHNAMNHYYLHHAEYKGKLNASLLDYINVCVELETPQPDGVKTFYFKLSVLGGVDSGELSRCLVAYANEIDFNGMQWCFEDSIKLPPKNAYERSILIDHLSLPDQFLKMKLQKIPAQAETFGLTDDVTTTCSSTSTAMTSTASTSSTSSATPSHQGLLGKHGKGWNNSYTTYFRHYFSEITKEVRGRQKIETYWSTLSNQEQNEILIDFETYKTARELIINTLVNKGRKFNAIIHANRCVDRKNMKTAIKLKAIQEGAGDYITNKTNFKQLKNVVAVQMLKDELMYLASDSNMVSKEKKPEVQFGPLRWLRALIDANTNTVKGYSARWSDQYKEILKKFDDRMDEIVKQEKKLKVKS